MYSEFEVIKHPVMRHINIFLVSMEFRTSHMHREFEVDFLLEGGLEVVQNNRKYTADSGEIILFNSNQPHELKSTGKNTLILCLQVSPKAWSEIFPTITNLVFDDNRVTEHLSDFEFTMLKELFTELAHDYYNSNSDSMFRCLGLLNSLFAIISRLPHHYLSSDEKAREKQKVERLNRILSYADENYMYNIRLGDLAEREGLTLSYLSHFFKENLNQSFQQHITSLRLNRAKQLVMAGNNKLLDICLECGFSDYRYLLKAFQQAYGCAPNEFRTLHLDTVEPTPDGKKTLEYIFSDFRSRDMVTDLRNKFIAGAL